MSSVVQKNQSVQRFWNSLGMLRCQLRVIPLAVSSRSRWDPGCVFSTVWKIAFFNESYWRIYIYIYIPTGAVFHSEGPWTFIIPKERMVFQLWFFTGYVRLRGMWDSRLLCQNCVHESNCMVNDNRTCMVSSLVCGVLTTISLRWLRYG